MKFLSLPMSLLGVLSLWASSLPLSAAPNLDSATITFIQKDVSIADIDIIKVSNGGEVSRRKATLKESINKDNAVVTGEKSRAELQFNDGSIARLGQLTSFTFVQGTRNMNLKQGTGLFNIPKGMGGTKIQAGPVTAAITGTTLLIQVYGDRVVIYVYEGSVDAAGQSIKTGQVLTIFNNGKTEMQSFDTAKAADSAALFTKFIDAPSQKIFDEIIAELLPAVQRSEVIDPAILDKIIKDRRESKEATPVVTPKQT